MLGGGIMAFWQIRTAKAWHRLTAEQYYWGNNYYTEAPTYADAWGVAREVIAAEALILTTDTMYCLPVGVGVHNMADVDRFWYVTGDSMPVGSWVSDGPALGVLGPCVYVRFNAPGMRLSRKWYRVGVDQALWDQGNANASFGAAFREFQLAFESVRPWLYTADGGPMARADSWEVTTLRKRHGTNRYNVYAFN